MGKKKILVVDDETSSLEAIKNRLEANNYLALGTSKAKEVFKLAEDEKPDLILLDIVMPDMNGYEICKLLKEGNKTKNIPIILLTGERLEPKSITQQCLNLGVESYLLKPMTLEDLFSKIKEVLGEN